MGRCSSHTGKAFVRFWAQSFLLVAATQLLACKSNLSVQTNSVAQTVVDDDLKIVLSSEATSASPLTVTWQSVLKGDVEYILSISHEPSCANPLATKKSSSTSIDLGEVEEGTYYLCLSALRNGFTVIAGNNGIKLDVDRTPPAFEDVAAIFVNQPTALNPPVTDRTAMTFNWESISGPVAAEFSDAKVQSSTISFPAEGTYFVALTATDAAGNTASKNYEITYDVTPPVVNVGADVFTNAAITRAATVSGEDTLLWSIVSGGDAVTFSAATSATTEISSTIEGTYVIRLTATDKAGNSAYDEFSFEWENLTQKSLRQIASGDAFSCGLSYRGKIYCWGDDTYGQLGNGGVSTSAQSSPVAVTSALVFKALSVGAQHACAISERNKIYCWGSDASGQLGDDGTSVNAISPVAIDSTDTFKSVSAGDAHTCAITTSGKAYCWGSAVDGRLGNGATTGISQAPVAVSDDATPGAINTFVSIAAGGAHSCGIKFDGKAYCWGSDASGQLGDDTNAADKSVPTAVNSSENFMQVSVGSQHSCGLSDKGAAFCWGSDQYGQLGDDATLSDKKEPVVVASSYVYLSLATKLGSGHTCAVRDTGDPYCWGRNNRGQLGVGIATADQGVPVKINHASAFTTLALGADQSCALTSRSTPYCWGYNTSGQLGRGDTATADTPSAVDLTAIPATQAIKTAMSGWYHECSIDSYGRLYCWGADLGEGRLGLGSALSAFQSKPMRVQTQEIFVSVSGGTSHTCAINDRSKLFCWGGDSAGALGNGAETANQHTPVAIAPHLSFRRVSAGKEQTCAISTAGESYCWGSDTSGALGNGATLTTTMDEPTLMGTALSFVEVRVADNSSCALTSSFLIYCWGSDTYQRLGNAALGSTDVPGPVNSTSRFSSLSFLQATVCAVTDSGLGNCWGYGLFGSVGNGSAVHQASPVPVSGGHTFIAVETGAGRSCGLDAEGDAWCWGKARRQSSGSTSTCAGSE